MTQPLSLLYSHHSYELIDLQSNELYLYHYQLHTQLFSIVDFIHNLVSPYTWGNGPQNSFSNYHILVECG